MPVDSFGSSVPQDPEVNALYYLFLFFYIVALLLKLLLCQLQPLCFNNRVAFVYLVVLRERGPVITVKSGEHQPPPLPLIVHAVSC